MIWPADVSSVALEVEARTDGAGGGAGRGLSVAER